MTVIHRTYLLDSSAFHQQIRAILFQDEKCNPSRLLDFAKEVVVNRTALIDEALILMRFDEEWLEIGETEFDNLAYWYCIALASFLKPNHNFDSKYFSLETILETVNWSESEIHRIIRGRNLVNLFKSLWDGTGISVDAIPSEELKVLWQCGAGYLSPDEANELLRRIENYGRVFLRILGKFSLL